MTGVNVQLCCPYTTPAELLALLGLFLVHDSFEVVALSAFILTLFPLVTNLTQLVLGVLAVSLRLALFLSLLTHFCVI